MASGRSLIRASKNRRASWAPVAGPHSAQVTLPLLRPAITSAASIVFLFTFTSFGVILILGGAQFATLEVEIYRQAAQLLDLRVAATLSVVQMGALALLLYAYARYQQRTAVAQRLVARLTSIRRPRTTAERALVGANLAVMAALLGLPLAVLVERTFSGPTGYGIDNLAALFSTSSRSALFVPPIEAVTNSLVFAAIATAICAPLGLLAAVVIARGRGRLAGAFDALLMLPLGTSAVIVGFGFLVSLASIPFVSVDLRVSPLLIPIAHALIALPFLVRATVPILRAVDGRLRDAAAVLGASPRRVVARNRPAHHPARRCSLVPPLPSPSRSANSAPPCSSSGPMRQPCRWPSSACSASPDRWPLARRWPWPRCSWSLPRRQR